MHDAEIARATVPGQVRVVGWEGADGALAGDLRAAVELDRRTQEQALAQASEQRSAAAHAPPPADDGLTFEQRASLLVNVRRLDARGLRPAIQVSPGKPTGQTRSRPVVTVWFDRRGGLPHLISCGASFRPRGEGRIDRKKAKRR